MAYLQINHVVLYGKYMYGLRKQYKIIRKCVVCKQLNNTELHVKETYYYDIFVNFRKLTLVINILRKNTRNNRVT